MGTYVDLYQQRLRLVFLIKTRLVRPSPATTEITLRLAIDFGGRRTVAEGAMFATGKQYVPIYWAD